MQKNDFEKQVRQQLEELSILPGEAVWEKVAAKVDADKKRRRVLFIWMFAGILLLAGGAGFWMVSSEGDNNILSASIETKRPGLKSGDQKTGTPPDATIPLEKEKNAEESTVSVSRISAVKKEKTPAGNYNPKTNLIRKSIALVKAVTPTSEANDYIREDITKAEELAAKHETGNSEIIAIRPNEELSTDKKTITEKAVESQDSILHSTVEKSLPLNKNITKQKTSSLRFGVTFLSGCSNNVTSGPFLPTNKSAERNLQFASPITNQSVASQPLTLMYNYSSSYSLGAGVFVQATLGKRWTISSGLDYQIMSAKISVGTRVDSLKTFQDSILQKVETVSSFYRQGQNDEYRNVYHLLQIPVNLQFQLNKNFNKPISLSAGLSGGYLIGSNALYINEKSRVFYREKDQLKRFMLSIQSGLAFTILNQDKFLLQGGPYFQHQMSNLTKPVIQTNEHLLFFGFKGNILFKKNK